MSNKITVSGVSPLSVSGAMDKPTTWAIQGNTSQNTTFTLPAGYTQLNYIESKNTTGYSIDTGIAIQSTDKLTVVATIKFASTGSGDNYLAQSTTTWIDCYNRGATWYTRIGSAASSSGAGSIGRDSVPQSVFELSNGAFTINSVSVATPTFSSESDNWRIWGSGTTCPMELYSFKVTNTNDSSVRFNGIPARRDSDGVLGVYDTVSGTFKANSGASTLIAGPEYNTVYGVGDLVKVPNQTFNVANKQSTDSVWGVTFTPDVPGNRIHVTGTGTINDWANNTGLSSWCNATTFTTNHKYYLRIDGMTGDSYISYRSTSSVRNNYTGPVIYTYNPSGVPFTLTVTSGRTYNDWLTVQTIDLTEMYGAGNEPSNVLEFKHRLGLTEYEAIPTYPYTAASSETYVIPTHITGKNRFYKVSNSVAVTASPAAILNLSENCWYKAFAYNGNANTTPVTSLTINDDNGITFTTTNASYVPTRFLKLKPSTQYTISATSNPAGKTVAIMKYVSLGNDYYIFEKYISSPNTLPRTFTTEASEGAMYGILFYGGANTPQTFSNIQVEEAAAATSYEAPVNLHSLISLPAPLHKISTYVDSINSQTRKITRNVCAWVLDGTENWIISSWAHTTRNPFFFNTIPQSTTQDMAKCNQFPTQAWSSTEPDHDCMMLKTNNILIWLPAADYPDAATFKAYLAAQYAAGTPVIVYYPLSASSETSTTIPVISTAKDATLFSTESDVAPNLITLTYYGIRVVKLTRAQYSGITPDSQTYYIISDEAKLYLGATQITTNPSVYSS